MSAIGYIQVRAYASYAELPLKDVAISVVSEDGHTVGMRLTDRSGLITPIAVTVPNKSESEEPYPAEKPYASVSLYAHKKGYETIDIETLQVFAGVTTVQNLEMIPLPALPWITQAEITFQTPPQDL